MNPESSSRYGKALDVSHDCIHRTVGGVKFRVGQIVKE
jgi:hypothetical protein